MFVRDNDGKRTLKNYTDQGISILLHKMNQNMKLNKNVYSYNWM